MFGCMDYGAKTIRPIAKTVSFFLRARRSSSWQVVTFQLHQKSRFSSFEADIVLKFRLVWTLKSDFDDTYELPNKCKTMGEKPEQIRYK
jgi:hypothetical protein